MPHVGSAAFNVLWTIATLFSGGTYTDVGMFCTYFGITNIPGKDTFYRLQKKLSPIITQMAKDSADKVLADCIAYVKSKGQLLLPISIDGQWAHRRQADKSWVISVAHSFPPQYRTRPIPAFSILISQRLRQSVDVAAPTVISQGNYVGTPKGSENEGWKRILEIVRERVLSAGMQLSVTQDGDLSNKVRSPSFFAGALCVITLHAHCFCSNFK